MNKLAKKMANREGFTLVELIVVIAILGILAGIAIPVYSGYIAKANEAADMQQLDAVKTAVVFAVVDKNPEASVSSITYTGANKNVVVTTSDTTITTVDIDDYVDAYTFKNTNVASWTWSSSTSKWTSTEKAAPTTPGESGSGT